MDHLQKIKFLGMGKFSDVYLVKNITSNEILVVKTIYLTNIKNLKELGYIDNEIRILKKIKNNNIIYLYNTFRDKDFIYLYLEYCNGGTIKDNLDKYIKKTGRPLPEKYVQHLMKQTLLGVKYLHDNGIIHRDLKLSNILLKYKNDYDANNLNILSAQAKIIDFNLSYIRNKSEPISVVGTLPNMAPSIIYNMNNNQKQNYDEKVDIWSLGTLCYEMFFGKPLFQNMTQEEMCNNIINADFEIPTTISNQAREFLYCMLQKHKINRYSARSLLNHQFIIGDYHNLIMYNNTITNIKNPIKLKKINLPKGLLHKNSNENILENKKNSNSPQKNIMNYSNYGNICRGCNKIIHGIYYKCLKCDEFYYCEECYYNNITIHLHSFEVLGGNIDSSFKIKQFKPKINYQKVQYSPKKIFFKKIQNSPIIDNHIQHNMIKKHKINVIFNYNGKSVPLSLDNDIKLDKLIESYFRKIHRNDLINNYENKYKFYYNAKNLNKLKDKRIGEIIKFDNSIVTVIKIDKF